MTVTYHIGKNVHRRTQEASARLKPEDHLGSEVLELLCSLYFFHHPRQESSDLIENLRAVHLMRLLHDDIVLRLCKFADEDTRSWSFDQAHKKIRKQHNGESKSEHYHELLDRYRDAIRPISAYRDTRVAHRAKNDRLPFRPMDFLGATRLVVEIVDILAGEKCSYKLSGIDLRRELLEDSTSPPAA